MIKLLIGGSPCTHWSIAQKNNRETEAEGIGWELFRNYLIAKEKFKPDYFLYENNKSAAQPIKDQISKELGVPLQYINSALVSAQNRQRFYAHNIPDVPILEDRGILLKDVLDSGIVDKEKAYCLKHQAGNARDYFKKHHTNIAFEPVPFGTNNEGKAHCLDANYWKGGSGQTRERQSGQRLQVAEPINDSKGKQIPIYEVHNGLITIKDKQYPIKLDDGYYIIRKLTVNECKRLQTVPDWYVFPVSDTQAYKMLGNGWTVEVIKHILSHIPNIQNEEIVVLSMYDGMSCGQIALKELGCNVVKYYATEIDKYAIQTTQYNFPNTIQLGDAFQVRNDDWGLPGDKVTCDSCGTDVFGKKYFTLNIRKVMHGKQTLNPAIYLCPKCFRETKLALLLCDVEEGD